MFLLQLAMKIWYTFQSKGIQSSQKFKILFFIGDMLEVIDLFPFSGFLRINKEPVVNHKCGGVSSLVIIIVLGSLFMMKLIEVINRTSVTFINNVNMRLQPPMATLSTSISSTQYKPFMVAFDRLDDEVCPASIQVNAYEDIYTGYYGLTRQHMKREINLVPCTREHFSVSSQLQNQLSKIMTLPTMLCLPLNQTYEIGGSYQLGNSYKSLIFSANCLNSCNGKNCGQLIIYQYNSLINPGNQTSPFQFYITKSLTQVANDVTFSYKTFLDQNILMTDQSIFPWQSLSTQKSLSTPDTLSLAEAVPQTNCSITEIVYERSSKTTTVNRQYLKLIDVISYVGGFFPTLFSCFFFLNYVGTFCFEMSFGLKYLKVKEAKERDFFAYLKYIVHHFLVSIRCRLNDPVAQKQAEVREAVNKVLDLTYLFHRIDFLQKALTVLFEKHQLKSLYLIHTATIEKTNDSFKNQNFRDWTIKFLYEHNHRDDIQGEERPESCAQLKNRMKSQEMSKQKQLNLGVSIDLIRSRKTLDPIRRIVNEGELVQPDIGRFNDLKQHTEDEEVISTELNSEFESIDGINEDEQWREELKRDLQEDIRKMMAQANRPDGDERSKKIYQMIEGWFRNELRNAIISMT